MVIHNFLVDYFSFFGTFLRAFFLPMLFIVGVQVFLFDFLPYLPTGFRFETAFAVSFFLIFLLTVALAVFFCLPQEVAAFQQLFPEVDVSWLTI